jgi:recombination associated protein RdgC
MGLLSSSVSITRYRVDQKIEDPVMENVYQGLTKNTIVDIDSEDLDISVGWTSFENPFKPDFEGSSFTIDTYFVFSLRIDRKKIPAKIIQKHYLMETARLLSASGRQFLSRNEKALVKEEIIARLNKKIPATPHVYDLVWHYEKSLLLFFSNLKSANEELETLFAKSFDITLIRLFPYTMADQNAGLTPDQRDNLNRLASTNFTE